MSSGRSSRGGLSDTVLPIGFSPFQNARTASRFTTTTGSESAVSPSSNCAAVEDPNAHGAEVIASHDAKLIRRQVAIRREAADRQRQVLAPDLAHQRQSIDRAGRAHAWHVRMPLDRVGEELNRATYRRAARTAVRDAASTYFCGGRLTCIVSTPSALKPASTLSRRYMLFTMSPRRSAAPATARPRRRRATPEGDATRRRRMRRARRLSIPSFRFAALFLNAGTRPNRMPVSATTPNVNARHGARCEWPRLEEGSRWLSRFRRRPTGMRAGDRRGLRRRRARRFR